ncbi:MAG: ankyrin repeat domain-containing protein [Pirellulales bacterium]|nr:ankyrin repeat domain-containing protein [Pirellulales bacterium]
MKNLLSSMVLILGMTAGCSEPVDTFTHQEVEFIPGNAHGDAVSLFSAVHSGNIEGIILAVESGIDVNAQDDRGATPLHIAAFRGEVEIAEYLLSEGADPTITNLDGLTALQTAEYVRHAMMVIVLGQASGIDSVMLPDAESTIWDAAREGNLTALEFHLSDDLDVNTRLDLKEDPAFGGSALHIAIMEFANEAVLYLIERGANVNLPAANDQKGTPLHWAVKAANDDGVRMLLDAGADRMLPDANGKLPLDILEKAPQEAENEIANIRVLLSEAAPASTIP